MNLSIRSLSFVYLLAVPVLVTALAFIIGHVNYTIYIPVWLLNAVLMFLAMRTLLTNDRLLPPTTAAFFIFPWMLFAIYGGMGPPPETASSWAALAAEQVVRYTFLIIGGISMATGFRRLNRSLVGTAGERYPKRSDLLMLIAVPLFILNMAYWGYFLTHVFVHYAAASAPPRPAWMKSLDQVFTAIRMVEVAFIYLSTAAQATALKWNRQLAKMSSNLYVAFACLGALLNILSERLTGPLAIAGYLSYIPAITLLMPYLIAVNLLWNSRNIGE